MRTILYLVLLLLFVSCGKSPTEEESSAIDRAQTLLSGRECQEAIDLLEDVGRNSSNAVYVQVLASAYACRAGYDEVTFLGDDIQDLDTSGTGLMKSLTQMTLSLEHEADSDSYQDIRTALHILLGTDTQTAREAKYGPRKSGDIGTYALLLSMVQLGKFLNFYGNVDSAGVKGLGAASVDEQGATRSTCFLQYTDSSALAVINSGVAGACTNSALRGHPNMSLAPTDLTTTKRRMCEGLMLVTNIIDILQNMALPEGDTFGNLDDISTTVSSFKEDIVAADPSLATLLDLTSLTACETAVADATEFGNLQQIYSLLFEVGLQ